jgi:Ca2+-binding RTX toxin-like protein
MGGRDAILAGAGNDTVRGGSGIDQIDGGKGADLLYGGAGKDVIDGSFGRDRIIGEAGRDQLTGGMSRDTFVFADGHGSDTITDFTAKGSKQHDVIDLTDVTEITGLRDLKLHHMQQVGADVVITDGSSHIVLTDVQLSDLSKADFLF